MMATTSIWSVTGWLGKVVVYVENPDKTENPKYFEKQDMTAAETQGLSDVIAYAVNTKKTQIKVDPEIGYKREFVSSINCLLEKARHEMMATKIQFGKNDGIVAFHGYQSFAPGEATPEMAHEIGKKLAVRLWGENYQVIVATHLDKENHLHNHFVVNSVSFKNGIRYHRTEKDYYDMQTESDKLCREYGLSVIEEPKRGKSKHYAEWKAEKEGKPTYRSMVKEIIDCAIAESMTLSQFYNRLRKQGCDLKFGEDITVRLPGKDRGLKLCRNFGEAYSNEGIRKRILSKQRPQRPLPEPPPKTARFKLNGNFKTFPKLTGFRALYFHYLYKMGILPKEKQKSPKQVYFLFREDLRKLDKITKEVTLLCRNHIDTGEQLSSYKDGLTAEIAALTEDRKHLRYKSRSIRDDGRLSEVIAKISTLSKRLGELRKEVHLCSDIEKRTVEMKEKLHRAEQEQNREKEVRKVESFRRRR